MKTVEVKGLERLVPVFRTQNDVLREIACAVAKEMGLATRVRGAKIEVLGAKGWESIEIARAGR